MAESKISISNQALIKCGANTITSFTDGTHEANVCSVMYDNVKKGLLYYTFWNFAIQKTQLNKLAETPTDKSYTNAHTIPGDVIRVKGFFDDQGYQVSQYSLEKTKVFSNQDPLFIEYVQDMAEKDLAVFFTEALIAKMALEINEAITGVGTLTSRLAEDFSTKLRAARITDGQENPPSNVMPMGRLVEAHLGGGSIAAGRLRHPD